MTKLERCGVVIGEKVGHRVWEVHRLDGVPTLRSWVYNCFWCPGSYVSDVSYTQPGLAEGPIDDDNQRGVWAFKTRDQLHEDFRQYSLQRALVYGTCYMWGTVIEHTIGYRSQYARILGLEMVGEGCGDKMTWSYDAPVNNDEINLDELRKRYGV